MRLKKNKSDISFDKVCIRLYWEEEDVWDSNLRIWYKQCMMPFNLINSNLLINSIYDEIKKE
jgi:hypothetical protein